MKPSALFWPKLPEVGILHSQDFRKIAAEGSGIFDYLDGSFSPFIWLEAAIRKIDEPNQLRCRRLFAKTAKIAPKTNVLEPKMCKSQNWNELGLAWFPAL